LIKAGIFSVMIGNLRMEIIIIYLWDSNGVSARGIVALSLESSLKILDINKYIK
jgi:hypothetical protein